VVRGIVSISLTGGPNDWTQRRGVELIPAAVIAYAFGISAAANGNWEALQRLTRTVLPSVYGERRALPLLHIIRADRVIDRGMLSILKLPGSYAQFSTYMHELLKPVLADSMFSVAEFDNAFDVFEFSLSLASIVLEPDKYPYIGRYPFFGTARRSIHEVLRPSSDDLSARGFVAAMFGGDLERLSAVVERLDQYVDAHEAPMFGSKFGNYLASVKGQWAGVIM